MWHLIVLLFFIFELISAMSHEWIYGVWVKLGKKVKLHGHHGPPWAPRLQIKSFPVLDLPTVTSTTNRGNNYIYRQLDEVPAQGQVEMQVPRGGCTKSPPRWHLQLHWAWNTQQRSHLTTSNLTSSSGLLAANLWCFVAYGRIYSTI